MNNLLNWIRLFAAQNYVARQEEMQPVGTLTIDVTKKGSDILTQWYYLHLAGCRDSGGYTCLKMIDGKLYAYSLCEDDHRGPGSEDCLYIDGLPLNRNETRLLRPGAEIIKFVRDLGAPRPVRLIPRFV